MYTPRCCFLFQFFLSSRSLPARNPLPPSSCEAFSCDTGFVLPDGSPTTATCEASGAWSADAPVCMGRECEALVAPDDGSVAVTNNGRYPSVASYACDTGYELDGSSSRRCMASTGDYEGTAPSCRGVVCPTLNIENAAEDSTEYRHPAAATVQCDVGFGLLGSATVQCQADGEWGDLPLCILCSSGEYAAAATSPCAPCPGCPDGTRRVGCGGRSVGTCEECEAGCERQWRWWRMCVCVCVCACVCACVCVCCVCVCVYSTFSVSWLHVCKVR